MPLQILFWMIYVMALFFGLWINYEQGQPWFKRSGSYLAVWLLIGILGWEVFGPVVRGR
jgi:hypothetical protein